MNKQKYTIKLIKDGETYKEEGKNCDIFVVSDQYNRTFTIKNFVKNGGFCFELYDKNNNKIIEYKNRDFNITGVATEKEDFDNWIKILTDFKEIIKDDNLSFTSSKNQQEVFYSFLARYSAQLKDADDCKVFCSKIDNQLYSLRTAGIKLATKKIEKYFADRRNKKPNKENIGNMYSNKEENKSSQQEEGGFFQKLLKNIFPSIYNFFYSKENNNNNAINNLNSVQEIQQKVA